MAAGTIDSLQIEISASAASAAANIDKLAEAMGRLKQSFSGGTTKYSNVTRALKEISDAAASLQDKYVAVAKVANALGKLSSIGNVKAPKTLADALQSIGDAAATITPEAISNLDAMTRSLQRLSNVDLRGVSSAMRAVRNQTDVGTDVGISGMEPQAGATGSGEVVSEIGDSANEAKRAEGIFAAWAKAINSSTLSMKGLTKALRQSTGAIGKFTSAVKRIAFYRIIRSMIKAVTTAFSEGLQKAYLFSSGMVGEGHRFAAALDEMKSRSNQMTGQLGSAFISLLAAIQPVLIRLIDLVTRAADAISQFFAAFTGTKYLKANATAAKFADNMKKGGAAAKEWKNQLLGFDEINRLEEPNAGGGGSGTNPLEGFDMEAADIEQKYLDAAEKVKNVIAWLKDNMPLVKGLALGIAGALAAWKVGSFVTNLPGLDGVMSKILGVALAIGGAIMFIVGACDAWKNGVDWNNMALMIGGVALAAAGLALVFGAVGAAIALIVGGLAMLVVGIRDWIKQGELSTQTFWLLEAAILAVGAGLALLVGWPALVVAAVAAAVAAIIYYFEEIKAWIIDLIEGFKALFSWKNITVRADQAQADGSIYLEGFASGGFPSEGQLFMANEAGPELVGTMGGRTAVANSDQIVEGIKAGVFEAVSSAMSGNGQDVSVKVYLDSREIRAGQERLSRAWG